MIELPNELIAISFRANGYPLIIVNPITYSIIKEIKEYEYINQTSSLCVLDTRSFIYACGKNEFK